MENSTMTAEHVQAERMFNFTALKTFLFEHYNEVVGNDKNGEPTTLINEIGEIARMSHRAYLQDGVNYYRTRAAYGRAEYSSEELQKKSDAMYRVAGKKILFLIRAADHRVVAYFGSPLISLSRGETWRASCCLLIKGPRSAAAGSRGRSRGGRSYSPGVRRARSSRPWRPCR